MMRILAFVSLAVMLAGCERYRSRAQGPFANHRRAVGQSPSALPPAPPTGRQPLVINTPAVPRLPDPAEESLLIPPRPPETPAASGVQPAGAVELDTDDRRRILPRRRTPAEPASPKAPAATLPAEKQDGQPQIAELKKIVQIAAQKWKTINDYEAKLTRREVVNSDPAQTQEVHFQFRKEPMSVYTKNTGTVGKGREILYYPAKHGDRIHIVVGEGDTPFLRAGSKGPALSPDDKRVRAKSRYSIREIGFGSSIDRFAKLVAGVESGKLPPDSLKYLGLVKRPEYGEQPLAAIEQIIRPGDETQTPKGGVRHWFFDAKPDSPSAGLPILVIGYENDSPKVREVEYYCFTGFRSPANLTDADFDPARMGR